MSYHDELKPLIDDLNDALTRTIAGWQIRHRVELEKLDTRTIVGITDNCLLDLTSPDEEGEDGEIFGYDGEPAESLFEEQFENSYIGGGGSPDLDNQ